jgi:hypothetical protein
MFNVNRHKLTFAALAAMAVTLSVAMLVSSLATPVQAKISEVDTSCTNGGGNQPGGQQPTCTGGGLTEPKPIRLCTTRTEQVRQESTNQPSSLFFFCSKNWLAHFHTL